MPVSVMVLGARADTSLVSRVRMSIDDGTSGKRVCHHRRERGVF